MFMGTGVSPARFVLQIFIGRWHLEIRQIKSFLFRGNKWRNYVETPRIASPILPKSVVNEIIEDGYIEKLSPGT